MRIPAMTTTHQKNIITEMYPTDSLETCDSLHWFIHICKYVSQKSLWDGLLLTMK